MLSCQSLFPTTHHTTPHHTTTHHTTSHHTTSHHTTSHHTTSHHITPHHITASAMINKMIKFLYPPYILSHTIILFFGFKCCRVYNYFLMIIFFREINNLVRMKLLSFFIIKSITIEPVRNHAEYLSYHCIHKSITLIFLFYHIFNLLYLR